MISIPAVRRNKTAEMNPENSRDDQFTFSSKNMLATF